MNNDPRPAARSPVPQQQAVNPLSLIQAVAASGLVSPRRLQELAGEAVTEGRLALLLVERGDLNAWQLDQVRQGRTRFRLGPYVIRDTLGRGGMGDVFKAEHELLGRIEAIKVLSKRRATPEAIARFEREIRAQAQLDHPNLVRVTNAGRDGGAYFLVMEYVPGLDLRRLIRRSGPVPIEAAVHVAIEVARGLDYAHRMGLVHRDIKPGNVLLTPDGRVKLTDLGLAWRLNEPRGAGGPYDRRMVGTSDYLAPELLRDPMRIMPVSDLYALGCTLYYAVTGKVLFPGGGHAEKSQRHLTEAPAPAASFRDDLPAGLLAALDRLLQKDDNLRTPTAAAAIADLAPLASADGPALLGRAVETTMQLRAASLTPSVDAELEETAVGSSAELESSMTESPVGTHRSDAPSPQPGQEPPAVPLAPQQPVTAGNALESAAKWVLWLGIAVTGLIAAVALIAELLN